MCRVATLNGVRPIDGSSGCLMISGVPGAGKTTVARLVADSLVLVADITTTAQSIGHA